MPRARRTRYCCSDLNGRSLSPRTRARAAVCIDGVPATATRGLPQRLAGGSPAKRAADSEFWCCSPADCATGEPCAVLNPRFLAERNPRWRWATLGWAPVCRRWQHRGGCWDRGTRRPGIDLRNTLRPCPGTGKATRQLMLLGESAGNAAESEALCMCGTIHRVFVRESRACSREIETGVGSSPTLKRQDRGRNSEYPPKDCK